MQAVEFLNSCGSSSATPGAGQKCSCNLSQRFTAPREALIGTSHSTCPSQEPAPRMFWPKEIWGRFADSLEDFKAHPVTFVPRKRLC